MYGFAQGIGDFLGDFNDESTKIRQRETDKATQDAAIEQKALEHLANADDPQIRAAAVTAMLTPKKSGGGSGLSKWFGQQRDHPVFDQVHQLINGGTQPFLSEGEKVQQHATGQEEGRLTGATNAYRNVTGEEPDAETMKNWIGGSVGAPTRKPVPKPVTLEVDDPDHPGKTMHIGGVEIEGQYYDQNYAPITSQIRNIFPSGAGLAPPKPLSDMTVTAPDPDHPGQFIKKSIPRDQAREGVQSVGPQAPPNQIFQTPSGFSAVDPRGLTVKSVQGGEGATKPEDATANYTTLRQTANDVYERAKRTVPAFAGLGMDAKELQPALDREAVVAGYHNWAELQQAVKSAQDRVGAGVQGAPPGPLQVAAPPNRGKAVPTKPGDPGNRGKPPVKGGKPGTPGATALPGQLDIDRIKAALAALDKMD